MRKIKKYQEFMTLESVNLTNEEVSWKNILSGALLIGSLNLTSCDTKQEFEEKKPQIENVVRGEVEKLNRNFPLPNHFKLHKIESISGPYTLIETKYDLDKFDKSRENDSLYVDKYKRENKYKTGEKLYAYFIISDTRGIPQGSSDSLRIWQVTSYFERSKPYSEEDYTEDQIKLLQEASVMSMVFENYVDAVDAVDKLITSIKQSPDFEK